MGIELLLNARSVALLGALAALPATAAVAADAPPAAATQVGQIASTPPPDSGGAGGNLVQVSVHGGASFTVPADGTITSWSHRGGLDDGDAGSVALLVWRQMSGLDYRLVGRSDQEQITPEVVNSFAVQIPVNAGDMVGLRCYSGQGGCFTDTGFASDVVQANGLAQPEPGDLQSFIDDDDSGLLANIAATLEPDAPDPGPPTPDPGPPAPDPGPTAADPVTPTAIDRGSLISPSNEFEIVRVKRKALTLKVAAAGSVQVREATTTAAKRTPAAKLKRRLRPSEASAIAAGKVTVRLRLTRLAMRKLRRQRKLAVRAAITFTPAGGSAKTKTAGLRIRTTKGQA